MHWGQGISSTAPRNTYKTHLSRLPPALIFNFSYSSSGVTLFSCSGVLIPMSYNPDAITGPIFRKDCKRLISLFRSIILPPHTPALYFPGGKGKVNLLCLARFYHQPRLLTNSSESEIRQKKKQLFNAMRRFRQLP